MALCAHLTGCGIVEEVLVLSSVRPVAAQTLQKEILVSRVLDLFTDGMSRVFLPVVAGPAEIDNGRLGKKEHGIGRVRRMTDGAIPFLYRLVFCLGLFLSLDSIQMAFPAESDHRRIQKALLRRSVRIMADRTPFLGD